MKYLIIPTNAFSLSEGVPRAVRAFYNHFKGNVFCIVDEISQMRGGAGPLEEEKKSIRHRTVKEFVNACYSRIGLTGTLMSKHPIDLPRCYNVLNERLFPDNEHQLSERHCVMMALRSARGRRVMISQKEWDKARKSLVSAFKRGGEAEVNNAKESLFKRLGLRYDDAEHILTHRKYTPFKNIEALKERAAHLTVTVRREDVFDISHEKFVRNPIKRHCEPTAKQKKLCKQLIDVGFTDTMTLGKAAALELQLRLQDVLNGFSPVKDDEGNVSYKALKENPKIDCLMELLEEIGVNDNQVVIWCSRTNAKLAVASALMEAAIPFVTYSGSQTDKEKAQAERSAEDGTARVFLANQRSAAYGLNCLKSFDYAVRFAVDGSVEMNEQAMARILRGQSAAPKFCYDVTVKGSVEERTYNALNAGQSLIGASNTRALFDFK